MWLRPGCAARARDVRQQIFGGTGTLCNILEHVFDYRDGGAEGLGALGAALSDSGSGAGRGDARPLPLGPSARPGHRADRQSSLCEMHRIQPPHLAVPAVRCVLDLARLRGPPGLARVGRHPELKQVPTCPLCRDRGSHQRLSAAL
jgi:hypothetical protein